MKIIVFSSRVAHMQFTVITVADNHQNSVAFYFALATIIVLTGIRANLLLFFGLETLSQCEIMMF